MRIALLKHSFCAVTSALILGSVSAQDFEPSAILGLERTYLTDYITCINLKASGLDYYSVSVTRDADNKIREVYAKTNPTLEDKEERTSSTINGNEIEYKIELRNPNDGINDFSLVQTERFFFDQTTKLDTMIITTQFDANTGQEMNSDTNYYVYSGGKLVNLHNQANTKYSNLIYSGNQLDSIKTYLFYQGSMQLWGVQKYNYTGTTLTSIEDFENMGSGLVAAGSVTVIQNASNKTTEFNQNNSVQYKFNESCTPPLGLDELIESKQKLNFYPNPTTGLVHFADMEDQKVPYVIYSIQGEEVQKGDILGGQIDVANLANGSYLIYLNGKTVKFTKTEY